MDSDDQWIMICPLVMGLSSRRRRTSVESSISGSWSGVRGVFDQTIDHTHLATASPCAEDACAEDAVPCKEACQAIAGTLCISTENRPNKIQMHIWIPEGTCTPNGTSQAVKMAVHSREGVRGGYKK